MIKQDIKQHVRSRFSQVAANYRSSAVHATGADLDLMVEQSQVSRNHIVLDAGCGAGHTAIAYAPFVKHVIACDFTSVMLEQVAVLAQERGIRNVTSQLADVEELPFPAAHFDIVATRYSAHHWQRPERALAECRRALKEDGVFIISDIMASEAYAHDTFLQSLELLRDPSHVRDYRISEWLNMMRSAGFQAEVIHRFALKLHFETWIQRMQTPRQHAESIKSLFAEASEDIKREFQLPMTINSDDFYFCIPGAVIKGQARP